MALSNKALIPGIAGLAVVVGLAGGSMLNASAANAAATTGTGTSTTTAAETTSATDTDNVQDETQGGHEGSDGTTEALLTGDAATKAKAAALAAVPGGTVQRVENDAEGAAYEAHMTKSDGTEVTVKMDSSFKVTGTETGHGHQD
jgi:uncharacterized membrane protein YkoI